MTGATAERDPFSVKYTPALFRALRVLRVTGEARESNVTAPATLGHDPTIYWQSRAGLVTKGLIESIPGRPGWYRLTEDGVRVAGQLP